MDSDPNALNDVLPSYSDFSDPNDDSGSDMLSFDEYVGLVDNPDEIVFACPNTSHVSSIDDMTSDPDPSGDTPASMGDVMLRFNQTSLTMQIHWTAPFLLFPLFPSLKPMYDTIC